MILISSEYCLFLCYSILKILKTARRGAVFRNQFRKKNRRTKDGKLEADTHLLGAFTGQPMETFRCVRCRRLIRAIPVPP